MGERSWVWSSACQTLASIKILSPEPQSGHMKAIKPCESLSTGAICATISMFLPQCLQRISCCIQDNVGYRTLFQGDEGCERIGTRGGKTGQPLGKTSRSALEKNQCTGPAGLGLMLQGELYFPLPQHEQQRPGLDRRRGGRRGRHLFAAAMHRLPSNPLRQSKYRAGAGQR